MWARDPEIVAVVGGRGKRVVVRDVFVCARFWVFLDCFRPTLERPLHFRFFVWPPPSPPSPRITLTSSPPHFIIRWINANSAIFSAPQTKIKIDNGQGSRKTISVERISGLHSQSQSQPVQKQQQCRLGCWPAGQTTASLIVSWS